MYALSMGYTRNCHLNVFSCLILMSIAVRFQLSQGAVYIRRPPKHQRVRAGQMVTFVCKAGADTLLDSKLTIRWRKDGEPFHASARGKEHYRKSDGGSRVTITNTSVSDTGVYSCTAQLGDDTASASAQLIVADAPDPPVDVELASCDNRFAQLHWKLISENYSPVTQFVIEFNTSFHPDRWRVSRTQLPRDRYYQRIALSPWANYSFRVIAQNAIGKSRPSLPTTEECRMPPDVPHHNPKRLCTRNTKPNELVITWQTMPKSEHNAPGFYCVVKWRRRDLAIPDEFHEVIVPADRSSLIVSHQPIYKPYELYVLAVNRMGEAVLPPKMVVGYSSEDVPLEIPKNFRLKPGKAVTQTTADLVWDAVDTGQWQIQGFFRGYKIQYWKTLEGNHTMRQHSIILREPDNCWRAGRTKRRVDVTSGHLYKLWPFTNTTAQVLVLNTAYEGPPSERLVFHTREGVPELVGRFRVHRRGPTYLYLAWEPPDVVNGILVGFTIVYQGIEDDTTPGGEVEVPSPARHWHRLEGLLPWHRYRVSIRARTRVGAGEAYTLEAATLPDGPPVAPNFTTVNISKRAVNVTWFPALNDNPGTVTAVEYRQLGTHRWRSVRAQHDHDTWAVVEGLASGVVYEMRVVARDGDEAGSRTAATLVKKVRIDMKRHLLQPSFKITYPDKTTFGIELQSQIKAIDTYYVNYRPIGSSEWRSTHEVVKASWITVRDLDPGTTYEVQLVAKDERGELLSLTKEAMAGTDPGAQVAVATQHGGSISQQSSLNFILMSVIAAIIGRLHLPII